MERNTIQLIKIQYCGIQDNYLQLNEIQWSLKAFKGIQ